MISPGHLRITQKVLALFFCSSCNTLTTKHISASDNHVFLFSLSPFLRLLPVVVGLLVPLLLITTGIVPETDTVTEAGVGLLTDEVVADRNPHTAVGGGVYHHGDIGTDHPRRRTGLSRIGRCLRS